MSPLVPVRDQLWPRSSVNVRLLSSGITRKAPWQAFHQITLLADHTLSQAALMAGLLVTRTDRIYTFGACTALNPEHPPMAGLNDVRCGCQVAGPILGTLAGQICTILQCYPELPHAQPAMPLDQDAAPDRVQRFGILELPRTHSCWQANLQKRQDPGCHPLPRW